MGSSVFDVASGNMALDAIDQVAEVGDSLACARNRQETVEISYRIC